MRHPAIEKVLDMEVNSTATSMAPAPEARRAAGRVVEIDLRIGEVREQNELVLLREGDEVPVEIEGRHIGGRVRGIADHEREGLRDRVHHGPLGRHEEVRGRLGGNGANHAARHEEAEGMDRVARVRHKDHVARRRDGLGHIGEALLGAERRHHLRVGIELHAEAARIVARLGAAKTRDALGGGVAVRARLARGLDELLDHVRRGREVRVAHAEIDDVRAVRTGGRLGAVHLLEHVRGQALDAVEIAHGSLGAADADSAGP
jgi:hypothetical protein